LRIGCVFGARKGTFCRVLHTQKTEVLGLVFELELPRDHNERVKKKLAELEKKKKGTGAK